MACAQPVELIWRSSQTRLGPKDELPLLVSRVRGGPSGEPWHRLALLQIACPKWSSRPVHQIGACRARVAVGLSYERGRGQQKSEIGSWSTTGSVQPRKPSWSCRAASQSTWLVAAEQPERRKGGCVVFSLNPCRITRQVPLFPKATCHKERQ